MSRARQAAHALTTRRGLTTPARCMGPTSMSDAALNEAVARAMGLEIRRWSDCPVGLYDLKRSHALKPGQLMRAHPDAGGCLLDHEGREWDILADDYSGVPAMEACAHARGLHIIHQTCEAYQAVRFDESRRDDWHRAPTYPRALALAIVAAVEAGR